MKNLIAKSSLLLICFTIFYACSEDPVKPADEEELVEEEEIVVEDSVVVETPITITAQDVTAEITENPLIGQEIKIVSATVSEGVASFSILSQSPSGAIAIDPNLGKVTVADSSVFDFETNQSITADVEISVEDTSITVSLTISVLNIAETIAFEDLTTSVDENTLNGEEVYALEATTDLGDVVFSFANEHTGAFAISADGVITVADGIQIDYEPSEEIIEEGGGLRSAAAAIPHFTLMIKATNSINSEIYEEATITINIMDIEGDSETEERLTAGQTPEEIYGADNDLASTLIGQAYQGGVIATFNSSDGSGLVLAPTQALGQTWADANSTAQALVLGGFDDWRLPTNTEKDDLCSNGSKFYYNNGTFEQYWTGTNCGGTCYNTFYFTNGSDTCGSGGSPSSASLGSRPVRVYGTPSGSEEGNGEISTGEGGK